MEEVRDAAAAVAAKSEHVRIDVNGLERLAADLRQVNPPAWLKSCLAGESTAVGKDPIHFFDGREKTLMYVLLLDAVNFCFWPSKFAVEYRGKIYGPDSRYRAVAAMLTRAFENGMSLDDVDFLANLKLRDTNKIFKPDTGIVPLLEERTDHIRDVGRVLADGFDGSPVKLFDCANWHAPDVVRLLVEKFRSYRDYRVHLGFEFPVLKRAQIFVSDTAMMFGNEGLGKMTGLDELTCFADYRLPQFMRAHGALIYTPELDKRIQAGKEIIAGSQEEVEIRANTIHVVEMLRQLMAHNGHSPSSREIDYLIWEERVRIGKMSVRHHCTLTTSY